MRWGLDRFVSKGPVAVIAAACILVLTISAVGGLLTLAVSSGSLANSAWNDFTQLLGGPGVQQSGAWSLRLISLAMVLVGMLAVFGEDPPTQHQSRLFDICYLIITTGLGIIVGLVGGRASRPDTFQPGDEK